jgi:hypothetical protein
LKLSIAVIASGEVSSLSLLEHPLRNQPLWKIFFDVLPGNWPLHKLEMSTRSSNALLRSNVQTLEELGNLSPKDIYDIRNTGDKTTKEILDAYISKLNVAYLEPELPEFLLSKNDLTGILPIESHIWQVLEVLATQLDRREVALISNTLSAEKIRLSEISETWGISRQRTYQIVDKLIEKFSSEDSIHQISSRLFSERKVLTKAEAVIAFPLLSLGASRHGVFLSVLDILIYSRNAYLYKGFILIDPSALDSNSDDPIVRIKKLTHDHPTQISDEVSKLLLELNLGVAEPVNSDSSFESSINRATAWLDNR